MGIANQLVHIGLIPYLAKKFYCQSTTVKKVVTEMREKGGNRDRNEERAEIT